MLLSNQSEQSHALQLLVPYRPTEISLFCHLKNVILWYYLGFLQSASPSWTAKEDLRGNPVYLSLMNFSIAIQISYYPISCFTAWEIDPATDWFLRRHCSISIVFLKDGTIVGCIICFASRFHTLAGILHTHSIYDRVSSSYRLSMSFLLGTFARNPVYYRSLFKVSVYCALACSSLACIAIFSSALLLHFMCYVACLKFCV